MINKPPRRKWTERFETLIPARRRYEYNPKSSLQLSRFVKSTWHGFCTLSDLKKIFGHIGKKTAQRLSESSRIKSYAIGKGEMLYFDKNGINYSAFRKGKNWKAIQHTVKYEPPTIWEEFNKTFGEA